MRNVAKLIWISLPAVVVVAGCSGSGGVSSPSVGGDSNGVGGSDVGGVGSVAGGQPGAGGNAVTGGTSSAAGTPASGGSNAVGGTTASGGSASTGGAKSGGGTASTGGTKSATGGGGATGGSQPTGGKASTSTGGATATGGANPAGGASTTGGTQGTTGGAKATGGTGTKATGGTGTKATGGSSNAAGGNPSTGGTSTAGGSASFKCANLSFAPSASGKTKPAGTAGGMKVLNWAGFSSAISYTFDDSNQSQINNYTAMKNAGGHYTFYLITSKKQTSDPVYKTALADGNEIGNHTVSHDDCTDSTNADVTGGQTTIKSTFGVTAYAFAAPDGSANCNVPRVQDLFLTDRSVAGGGSIAPGDISQFGWLPADIPATDGSGLGPIAGKWRVFCIHGFQDASGGNSLDGAYHAIPLSPFTSAVQSAISGGSWVETVTNIAAYNWGQHAIGTNATSASWTLPSVFPPNMCVRITTTGGTVTQNGADVPWDDHGYYEISLDAGKVTVQ